MSAAALESVPMSKLILSLQTILVSALAVTFALAQTANDGPRRGSGWDEWTVDCSPPGKDQPEECHALVHYYPGADDLDGPEGPARLVYMFSVSDKGVKFHELLGKQNSCSKKPSKKMVDDKSIQTFPVEKQIEAVLRGRLYSFEYLDLPCNLVIKFTTVVGASLAYERMMERWANRDLSSGREILNRKP
jgi:hypothetical protein